MINITEDRLVSHNLYCGYIITNKEDVVREVTPTYYKKPGLKIYALERAVATDVLNAERLQEYSIMSNVVAYAQALVDAHCELEQENSPFNTQSVISGIVTTTSLDKPKSDLELPDSISNLLKADPIRGVEAMLNYYKALNFKEQARAMQQCDAAASKAEDRISNLETSLVTLASQVTALLNHS